MKSGEPWSSLFMAIVHVCQSDRSVSTRHARPHATRRPMAAAIAAALALLSAAVSPGQTLRTRTVLSEGWFVKQLDAPNPDISGLTRETASPDKSWLSARMPAQVHDVLLQHTAKGPVFLEFQGLDTLATAYLNGVEIGRFDDMYRQYRVEVGKHLAPARTDNVLVSVFRSPVRYLAGFRPPPAHQGAIPPVRYLRKAPPDFTSYLGARPNFIKVGVFRDVVLDAPGPVWIDGVWVRSEVSPSFSHATLRALAETSGGVGTLEYVLLDPSGNALARGKAESGKDFAIDVPEPKLWWPRMYGSQPLYRLTVSLTEGGRLLDSRQTNIGIREVKPMLKDAATGEDRFGFLVNGWPVYFRGGCWAPIEHMSQCWLPDRARRLLDLAEHGRMNILRVWGEGVEPPACAPRIGLPCG